ncbi:MFS transporter [Rodentibacter trehalosifermentans]|uniref:MFS transporter n=1 Tax=Rodentibacter trehalosifermentans TaxID=1908263 RepID=UPI00098788B2|nr:MFS transporter [Rodentibacter trehalosifermentans]
MKSALNLFSLFFGQALSGSVISLLTLSSTLVGNVLSPQDFLVSLPITMTVLGSAISVYFASFLMAKYGRRTAFIMSGLIGIVGALLAIYAIYKAQFYLFSLATFILGGATVFNQYYRFAAAEVFDDEVNKKRATSLIISAGIVGGVLGPFLATKGANLLAIKYVGIFWLCFAVFVLLIISQLFLSIKNPQTLCAQNQPVPKDMFLQKEFKIGTAC